MVCPRDASLNGQWAQHCAVQASPLLRHVGALARAVASRKRHSHSGSFGAEGGVVSVFEEP